MTEFNLANISRIQVVHAGGAREFWGDSWQASLQDDGHTLKLVATGEGLQAQVDRAEGLTDLFAKLTPTSRRRVLKDKNS